MRLFTVICLLSFLTPAAFSQLPAIGGCQVFPADNPWNLDVSDVSQYPVHSNSDIFIRAMSTHKKFLHADFGTPAQYGIPFVVVDNSQPFVQITYDAYGNESDPGPFPIPADAPVEGGANSGGDMHVLVIDKSNCMLYELFSARKDQTGSGWTAASGAKFDLTKTVYRPDGWTSADAAGLPVFPGLARYEEVAAGAINHALRFTTDTTQAGWINPARHKASRGDTHYPPMGLRVRMKASYDISGVTGQAKIILQALKKYGMILADNGSSWYISGTSNPLWSDDDLNQLKSIPGSAFEAVYTGPIKTSASSITVITPKAGEIITGGSTNYLVQCTTSGVDTLRTLEFSSDGGAHWSVVNGNRGTKNFTWSQIPNVATTQGMIRISDEMANIDTSGIFTITSKSSASITNVKVDGVTNGHISTGMQTTISWSSSGNLGSTLLAEYSVDGSSNWLMINNTVDPALHSIPWTASGASPTAYVKIRSSGDPSLFGQYGPFTIDATKGVDANLTYTLDLSNYPNPVSGKTEINFSLPEPEFISLKIFNAEGIQIANLISGEMGMGNHSLSFDAHSLPEGIYFLRLNARGESVAKKMVVIR